MDMTDFEQQQTKKLILKAMKDIKKFEKYSQEDQKRINGLKGKIGKQDQKQLSYWKKSKHSKNFQKC